MTNEEKILQKLDQLTNDVGSLKANVTGLETKFTRLDNRVDQLPTRDEVPTLEQVREVVKEEVRSEVSSQLEIKLTEKLAPLYDKLDDARQTAKDDAGALGATEAHQDRRLDRFERELHLKPLLAR